MKLNNNPCTCIRKVCLSIYKLNSCHLFLQEIGHDELIVHLDAISGNKLPCVPGMH